MPENFPSDDSPGGYATLIGQIVSDGMKLLEQELMLARVEVQREWVKAKAASAILGAAAFVASSSLVILAVAAAFLLASVGVALWLSFGIVSLLLALTAFFLYRRGSSLAKVVDFVPREAMQSTKENVTWLKNRTA